MDQKPLPVEWEKFCHRGAVAVAKQRDSVKRNRLIGGRGMHGITILFVTAISVYATNGLEIPVASDTASVVHHSGFTLEYAEPYEQARWVAYEMDRVKASVSITRTDNFRPDPAVKTGSAALADYSGSGYDRGHLFPAGDAWDSASMTDCFFLSNMSPQTHSFNAGIWEKLETQVRTWATTLDTLYVVAGGVLKPGLSTIGPDSVAVPESFYKVILCKNGADVSGIGFVMKSQNSTLPLKSFAVTIDSVEKVTGIDFFPQLPDSLETAVESRVDTAKWFSGSSIVPQPVHKKRKVKRKSLRQRGSIYFDLKGRRVNEVFFPVKAQMILVGLDGKNLDILMFLKDGE